MNIVVALRSAIARALEENGVSVSEDTVVLEYPADFAHGDYATGAALAYAKQAGMTPRELAEKIVTEIGTINRIAKIEIAGPGFVNFFLSSPTLSSAIDEARTKKGWGKNSINAGKRVMVEYTDPNPFKEFHIGHLMSNAIGEATARLIEFSGAEVRRVNYQGDVGLHVAKAIWSMTKGVERGQISPIPKTDDVIELSKYIARAYALGSVEYATSEHMGREIDGKSKKEIDDINKKIYEKSDPEINKIYEWGRKVTLDAFEKIYKVLDTKFDHYFFESEAAPEGMKFVHAHPDVFVQSEGATVYKGEKAGLHTRVFITSKGLPTYEAKELGLAKMKATAWPFDMSVTVTASEQSGYFEVVLAAMRDVLPELAPKIKHISHGMMRLLSGKMSSRTGDVVTGESLLLELTERAKIRAAESRADNVDVLAGMVAVAAVKYQILKQASGKDIIFDRERALSLEGDSGPYLQYAHARAQAIVEKAVSQGVTLGNSKGDTFELTGHAKMLSRLLHRFPEAVEYAAHELEPHLLTNYLLEFASMFNRWYANEQIIDGTPAASHKVALVDAVRVTLKNGLWLLGIPAPEKM